MAGGFFFLTERVNLPMVPQWWRKFTLAVIGKCEKRGNDAMILENAVYPPSAGAAKKRRVEIHV